MNLVMSNEEIMQLGVNEARKTMKLNIGGPFGAVITKGEEVIAVSSNHVLANNDPTAHAEVMAIREACSKLGTYDLSECELYATSEPCPMCMSAIIWANIKKVYYCGSVHDAEEIGFRDDHIYKFIQGGCTDKSIVDMEQLDPRPARMLFKEYVSGQKTIY